MKNKWFVLCAGLLLSSLLAWAGEPFKLAFVDTGNTGRSVTAEALANQRIAQQHLAVVVISRAVDQDPYDSKPEANAATLLLQRGIDVSAHQAVQLNANDIRHSDLILTMTAKHKAKVLEQFPEAKGKTFTLAEYADGSQADVADAWGKPMEVYQQMLRQIDGYLPLVLQHALQK